MDEHTHDWRGSGKECNECMAENFFADLKETKDDFFAAIKEFEEAKGINSDKE